MICAVCGSGEGDVRARENGFALLQCGCGAMFLDRPVPDGLVDPAFDPHSRDFYALSARFRLNWAARRFGRLGTFVEIGCGDGQNLAAALAIGFTVEGIDYDPDRARRVAAALAVPVEGADVMHSSRADASVDLLYHCDLLSHLPDPAGALVRMRAMLRPGGAMAFEVGIVGGLERHWYREGTLQLPHHRWFFSEEALRALLDRAGFETVTIRRFGLGPLVHLSRLAGRLGLGGGATRAKVFSEGGYRDKRTGRPENSTGRGTAASRIRSRAYAFARYRIGALTPRFGPGTAFVFARPL